jgi:predicted CXXCH cytochrome family protein
VQKRVISISLTLFVIIFSACSSSSNYETLSMFFDGVPDPNEQKKENQKVVKDTSNNKRQVESLKPAAPKYFLHGPYGAKLCGDCHNVNNGFTLTKKEPQLCYGCHNTYESSPKFPHGPVDAGYCSTCHHPHRSENKHLLVNTGNSLCEKCHNASENIKSEIHINIINEECISCHDPHGNDKQYFIQ